MNRYIGTKIIDAEIAANPKDGVEGYRVVYADGYTSWSPREAFEEAYRPCEALTFGLAIEALKKGRRVARAGWNGKGMWLGLVEGYEYNPDKGEATAYALGCVKLPWIGMKTADGCFVPWLASQTDMLAEDWTIVDGGAA